MQEIKLSSEKLVIAGSVVEYYQYSHPVIINPTPLNSGESISDSSEEFVVKEKKEKREDSSIYRSKKKLKRLVNANVGFHIDTETKKPYMPIFVTLTFKENIQDITLANRHYSKFIQRLNYQLFNLKKNILKYVVAIEFQKRGAVHYHAIFFNLPFRRDNKKIIRESWREGHINIKGIKNNIKDVGNYLTKYMTKEHYDSRLVGKKCYFLSRNLNKPIVIKDPEQILFLMNFLGREESSYHKFIDNPQYGPAYLYTVYNVEDKAMLNGFLDLLGKSR